jgi:hypothetical protein
MAIILLDKAMATEIFVEVFLKIYYITQQEKDIVEKFQDGLNKILETSTKFDQLFK